ncbi:Bestrophin [Paragonimus heterotremus]|uniref:Bestrophin homolog n=1 Tax=Paragonimus heterotremus TaxID=100268 RepID=A0A8J4TBX7_9TREM|nr:Bestrophin [Paragonimus heterotremus]
MTVSYTSLVATTKYTTFLRLLFIWRGSVYRLIWFEFLIFVFLYTILSLVYRFALYGVIKTYFENACLYCNKYNNIIPVPFVLGFYVALVVNRWWEQFQSLPWPDQIALYLTAFCRGTHETPTRIRRTIMRYVNLSYCIALCGISSRARSRFPTEDHLISAGLVTTEELEAYRNIPKIGYTPYYAPLLWSVDMIVQARRDGYIEFDRAVEILNNEINSIRGLLGTIFSYDWINPPLVYTQVAESLINPFGEDADDFEIEHIIERNLNVSYMIVDNMQHAHQQFLRRSSEDLDWTKTNWFGDTNEQETTPGSNRLVGSLANVDMSDRKRTSIFPERLSIAELFLPLKNLRFVI